MDHRCREVRIPISWGTLAGKLWVPSTPTHEQKSKALALHGWYDNAGSFDPLIQFLPRDMTLLALDLPGHGFSDHYNKNVSYYFTGFISDIVEVLSYLAWKRPILIGHSMGGVLANLVAVTLQNEISKLIIIEAMYTDNQVIPDVFVGFMQRKYEEDAQVKPNKAKLYSSKLEVAKSILRGNPDISNLSSAECLATRSCKEVEGGFVLTKDRLMTPLAMGYNRDIYCSSIFPKFYDRLTMPILYINAKKSKYTFREWMERDGVVKLPSTSQIMEVGEGHMVHMNAPDQVGKIIREFITQRYTSKL